MGMAHGVHTEFNVRSVIGNLGCEYAVRSIVLLTGLSLPALTLQLLTTGEPTHQPVIPFRLNAINSYGRIRTIRN